MIKQKFLFYLTIFSLTSLIFGSCSNNPSRAILLTNGHFYTLVDSTDIHGFMIVQDGKIAYIGKDSLQKVKYTFQDTFDLKNQFVYPGLIDAHCHFYGLGFTLLEVDLMHAQSFNEVLERVKTHASKNPQGWIKGRGWDQNLWKNKEFPTKDKLDSLFPNRPVFIKRVDGHAVLVNSYALKLAGIDSIYSMKGGEIMGENNVPNGILIDNAIDIVKAKIPALSRQENIEALQRAEKMCYKYGLTSLTDAGLPLHIALLIDSMQKVGMLNMDMNIMLEPNKKEIAFCKKNGIYKTDKLQIRSFKLYADGALGSRGALLKHEYCDRKGHIGTLLTPIEDIKNLAEICYQNNYQLCTHSIGDSSSAIMLKVYAKHLKSGNDLRWRIEHAQVLDLNDIDKFSLYNIIPSVQPTHATSDGAWAEERLCNTRMKGAYAYRTLLDQLNYLPLGTDFPVESLNPMRTFHSAIFRYDLNDTLQRVYQSDQSLTRFQTLKGMTIWAAKAQFQENERGTLEIDKKAVLTIFKEDLLHDDIDADIMPVKVFIGNKWLDRNSKQDNKK